LASNHYDSPASPLAEPREESPSAGPGGESPSAEPLEESPSAGPGEESPSAGPSEDVTVGANDDAADEDPPVKVVRRDWRVVPFVVGSVPLDDCVVVG
jgi:hypothetical protein